MGTDAGGAGPLEGAAVYGKPPQADDALAEAAE